MRNSNLDYSNQLVLALAKYLVSVLRKYIEQSYFLSFSVFLLRELKDLTRSFYRCCKIILLFGVFNPTEIHMEQRNSSQVSTTIVLMYDTVFATRELTQALFNYCDHQLNTVTTT